MIITNIQNINDLIGRKECNIARIVPSTSELYSLTKKATSSNSVEKKNRNLFIEKMLITNY